MSGLEKLIWKKVIFHFYVCLRAKQGMEFKMKENIEKIKEILKENVNIIELDTLIEELRKSKYLNDLLWFFALKNIIFNYDENIF